MSTTGLHHVTAIAGDARRNLDFYGRTLGLRLVKKTVNFDDPGTHHLYFGDADGAPGSILTFFPWGDVASGRTGIGETSETALRVPEASLGFWTHRLVEQGVRHESPDRRFGQSVLRFRDPDGMRLALVGVAGVDGEPAWDAGAVPPEHAIRGLHGVTLMLERSAPTAAILTGVFGLAEAGRDGAVTRFVAGVGNGAGAVIDLQEAGGFLPARQGSGSVHHIAFRARDDADQAAMVERLANRQATGHGIVATEQKDRHYFRSVYFREPGGVLFEIATDAPGFAVDEPAATLGQELRLPAFLEPRRTAIEAVLPELA